MAASGAGSDAGSGGRSGDIGSSQIWKREETDSPCVPGVELEEANRKAPSSSEPREPDKIGEPINYAQMLIYNLTEIHGSAELSLL